MSKLTRDTARVIHGSVQTRLVACAIAIDQSTRSHDTNRLNVALREAIDVLEAPLLTEPDTNTLEEQLLRKADLWKGISHVEAKIEDCAHPWPVKVAQVGLIVKEGLANDIRRGDATWALITLTTLADRDL